MQLVGVICYLCFFFLAWPSVRCIGDGLGTWDCSKYCSLQNKTQLRDLTDQLDVWSFHPRIGSRILQETSVVFPLLAMFCRVCRDFSVYHGLWKQRWSILIPFALLMLHSLVSQNSLIIILGVLIFVSATIRSASIDKF